MKIGDFIYGRLGSLSFGGKIIMIANGREIEYSVELPCGQIIRAVEVYLP